MLKQKFEDVKTEKEWDSYGAFFKRVERSFIMFETGEFGIMSTIRPNDRRMYSKLGLEIDGTTLTRLKFTTPDGKPVLPAWLKHLEIDNILIDHQLKIAISCRRITAMSRPNHLTTFRAYYPNTEPGTKPIYNSTIELSLPSPLRKEDKEWVKEIKEAAYAIDKLEDEYIGGYNFLTREHKSLTMPFDIRSRLFSDARMDPADTVSALSRYEIACIAKRGFSSHRKLETHPYLILL